MKTLQAWAFEHKRIVILLVILNVFLGTAIIGQSYTIVQIVNAVFIEQTSFSSLQLGVWGLLLFLILRTVVNYSSSRLGLTLSQRVKHQMRGRLLTKWTHSPLQLSGQDQTGGKVTAVIELVDQLDAYFREYVPQVIKSMVVPFLILIAVFYVNPNSGWILLITAPFIPISYIVVGLKTQQKSEQQLGELTRFSGRFLDNLQGLQTLKLFGRGPEQAAELKATNDGFQRTTLSILKIAFASSFFIELIITLGIGLLALEIGFQMLVFETLAFAPAFFILAIAPEYYTALRDLGAAFHTGRGSLAAADALHQELQREDQFVRWGKEEVDAPIGLVLDDVQFSYDQGFTLSIPHLTIEPGVRAVIVGPSGQGKTTLLNILAGVYEAHGEIKINGKLRETYSEDSWWRYTSYISQHPYIFSGTIRDNISMGETPTESQLHEAITSTGLEELIASLPAGLDTPIGEGGRGLSGGEKQRIALARSFIKQPRLIFYDEPTSGLDVKTEQILVQAIDQLAQDATVVTVAHRISTIRKAERLYVIQNGQLVAEGSLSELVDSQPYVNRVVKGGAEHEDLT